MVPALSVPGWVVRLRRVYLVMGGIEIRQNSPCKHDLSRVGSTNYSSSVFGAERRKNASVGAGIVHDWYTALYSRDSAVRV